MNSHDMIRMNRILFSTPLMGVGASTKSSLRRKGFYGRFYGAKLFSTRKMQKIISKILKIITMTIMMILLLQISRAYGSDDLPHAEIPMDEGSVKRGEKLFNEHCKACHGLKYYEDDKGLRGIEAEIDPESAADLFGKVPPDLTLMAKARGKGKDGALYIYQLLITYYEDEEGLTKNRAFAKSTQGDGTIAMPPPFTGDDPELDTQARDIAAYLYHVAEPTAEERKRTGKYVMSYMVVLTALLYSVNRKIWKNLKKGGKDDV